MKGIFNSRSQVVHLVVGIASILVVNLGVFQWGHTRMNLSMDRVLTALSNREVVSSVERVIRDSNRHIELAADAMLSDPDEDFLGQFISGFRDRIAYAEQEIKALPAHNQLGKGEDTEQLFRQISGLHLSWENFLQTLSDEPEHAMEILILESDPKVREILNGAIPEALLNIGDSYSQASSDYARTSQFTHGTIFILMVISLSGIAWLVRRVYLIEVDRETIRNDLIHSRDVAESATKAKSSFLSNMSHEIRTPMNGVIGMANLLAASQLPSKHRKYIDILKISADSALSIVNEILDFESIESGKIELSQGLFSMRELAGNLEDMLQASADEKGLSLSVEISDDCPDLFTGDIGRISQILVNLMNNAIKFTKKGFVRLTINADNQRRNHWEVAFSVIDTGIGIETAQSELIFESFRQADNSIRREYGGTGLGLSITKNLVDLMGGSIKLVSAPNKGSCFTVYLPLEHSAQKSLKRGVKTKTNGINDPASFGPLNVLVVDDNLMNLEVASFVIQEAGWQCVCVSSGSEALESVQGSEFDVILMDCHMQGMDGFETSRKIQAAGINIPIIAITADVTNKNRAKCRASKMFVYVSKPFIPNDLRHTIMTTVARNRASKLACGQKERPIPPQNVSAVTAAK